MGPLLLFSMESPPALNDPSWPIEFFPHFFLSNGRDDGPPLWSGYRI